MKYGDKVSMKMPHNALFMLVDFIKYDILFPLIMAAQYIMNVLAMHQVL